MGRFVGSLLLVFLFQSSAVAQYSQMENEFAGREFIRSCTYGVLAGTLVGAATLAFTEQPGENINRVARGASLGLYAGILLGLYVIYVVPNQMRKDDLEDPNLLPPEVNSEDYSYKWGVFPLIGQNGLDGAGLGLQLDFF
jgi:hypothetical protein